MRKKLLLRLVLLGLMLLWLLTSCSQPTPVPVTATPVPTRSPNPTATVTTTTLPLAPTVTPPVALPTATANPVTANPVPSANTTAPTTVSAQAELQKAVQALTNLKSFKYTFEQNAELRIKNTNSLSRLQTQGTGEIVRPDIRQSFTLSQSGQRQPLEQIVLNGQGWQKLSTIGLWRKLENAPKFGIGLTPTQLAQVSAVTVAGTEKIGANEALKISFKLPASLLYDATLGGSLEALGLLSASNLWSPLAALDPKTQPALDYTVWIDWQSGLIVQQTATINLNTGNSSLLIKTSYQFNSFNQTGAAIQRPPDLPQ